jgi:YfiH family protein
MSGQASHWLVPDWPAPATVHALSTLRTGGVSTGPFASWNLAGHVGDGPEPVARNRALLRARLQLPGEPAWLEQVHGRGVREAGRDRGRADASYTGERGTVCAVLTADCLPVLFCRRDGNRVAAAHAGWRGLAAGVLEATVAALDCPAEEIMAWLGPAIGPEAFEVGPEVRAEFVGENPAAAAAFRPSGGDRYLTDLYALARDRLAAQGVEAVYGGGWCTYRESERFFSYRRDGVTGRMATLIWLQ